MSFKYLKSRDKVFESWFNPILSGNTNQGSNILPPGSYNPTSTPFGQEPGGIGMGSVNFHCTNDMIEKPAWLDNDEDTVVRNGDILSIGSFFLNGVPLSSWSANFGSQVGFHQSQTMRNWVYLDTLTKQLFPDGIKAYLSQEDSVDYSITKLTIIRLVPNANAIGLNAYIKFNLNEIEIWGKFENIGIDIKPKFICGDITMDQLPIESKIKIEGKLWNTMTNWFKAKTGVYKCIAKDVLVYSELGQLKRLSEGNAIEVLNSDDNKIKIKFDNTVYFIKKPTYFWFNWYFEKK